MLSHTVSLNPSDEEFLPICPINQTVIEHPVTDEKGHTFEEEVVLKWITQNEEEKKNALCPIDNLHILKRENLRKNFALQAQIDSTKKLLAKINAQTQIIHQQERLFALSAGKEEKSTKQPIKTEMTLLLLELQQIEQSIADIEYTQHSYIAARSLLGHTIQKRVNVIATHHHTIKHVEKSQCLAADKKQQNDIKLQIQQALDAPDLVSLLAIFTQDLKQVISDTENKITNLRNRYQNNIVNQLPDLQKRIYKWFLLGQQISLATEQLTSLRQLESDTIKRIGTCAQSTTQNMLTKLGGLKNPAVKIKTNAKVLNGKDEKKEDDALTEAEVQDLQVKANHLKSTYVLSSLCSATNEKTMVDFMSACQQMAKDVRFKAFIQQMVSSLTLKTTEHKDTDLYIALIRSHIPLEWLNYRGDTPLIKMIRFKPVNQERVVQEVLLRKQDFSAIVNNKGKKGDTALHWAAYQNYEKIVSTLLDLEADPTIKNDAIRTPLQEAENKHINGLNPIITTELRDASYNWHNQGCQYSASSSRP